MFFPTIKVSKIPWLMWVVELVKSPKLKHITRKKYYNSSACPSLRYHRLLGLNYSKQIGRNGLLNSLFMIVMQEHVYINCFSSILFLGINYCQQLRSFSPLNQSCVIHKERIKPWNKLPRAHGNYLLPLGSQVVAIICGTGCTSVHRYV